MRYNEVTTINGGDNMFCVIQKLEGKRYNDNGAPKELEVSITDYTINGERIIKYGYRDSFERFERSNRDRYRISIHHSYREDGKVKKKQWSICTIGYYDIFDFSTCYGDYMTDSSLDEKLGSMDITLDELDEMIYEKFDPIIESIREEFSQTEEYKTAEEHAKIKATYWNDKRVFEKRYGSGTYERIYDVFGNLRNKDKLDEVKEARRRQEEYTEREYKNYRQQWDSGNSGFSGLFSSTTTRTEDEKKMLNEIYRHMSLKFHPDTKSGSDEKMIFLNKLKDEWGI